MFRLGAESLARITFSFVPPLEIFGFFYLELLLPLGLIPWKVVVVVIFANYSVALAVNKYSEEKLIKKKKSGGCFLPAEMRQDGCRLHPILKKYNVVQIRWFCGASPPDPAHQRSASPDWPERRRTLLPLARASALTCLVGGRSGLLSADSRVHIPEDILFRLLALLTHLCRMHERKSQKWDHQYRSLWNEKFQTLVGQSSRSQRLRVQTQWLGIIENGWIDDYLCVQVLY